MYGGRTAMQLWQRMGSSVVSRMTDSPCNSIFSITAKESAQRKEKDKVRKSRECVKEKRQKE